MNKKNTRSISSTLAIAFFILSISALLIAGTFQIYIHWQTQSKTIAANQQLIAENAANTVANFIQRKFSIMDTAISLGHWTLGSQKESQSILESMLGLDDSFRNLVSLDSTGRKTAMVSRQSQLLSANYLKYINHETFIRLRQTKRYISPISIDEETYEPLVTLAAWTTDIYGDFTGILVVEVNLKFIWNLIDDLKIGDTGQSYVVNRKGDLLASKDISRVIRGENMGDVIKVAEFINDFPPEKKNEASLYRGLDDKMVIGIFVALESPDWAVVTELPVKEAYKEVIKSILVSTAILLLIAAAAVCIGFFVSRRLATPLINLTSTASRIAKGETGLVASIEGPREISILADAFNNMTGQLSQMLKREKNRGRELLREIDQRKLAEEKLRLNEERLDLALAGANDGVWDWNPKNDTIHFDSRYYTMSGYEPYEFPEVFEEWEKRIHPDDIESAKAAISHYMTGESETFEIEFRFLRKESNYMWIRGKGKIVSRDKEGNPNRFVGTHSDINQRKQAEKALDEAFKIINNSPLVAFIWRNEEGWPVEFVTDNIENILGYKPDELLSGKVKYDQIVYLDDLERVGQEVAACSADQNCQEFMHEPYRVLTKKGEIRWVDDRTYIRRDEEGKITHYQGIILDITEQKEAEVALRNNEQLLSNIIESMQEGILVLNGDFRYTHWNRSMEEASHTPREEVLGTLPWEKFPFLKGDIEDAMKGAMNGEILHNVELNYELPDGVKGWTRESYFPLKDSADNINGVVGVIEEITERKQAEDELRSLRNYLTNIIDSMPSALVGVDMDGRVTQWNKTVERTTGIAAGNAQGKSLSDILPWMASEMKNISKSIQSRQVIQEQKRPRPLKDDICYEDVTIYPLITNGVEGAVIRIDDVTEKVRLEEMMIQSEKMLSVGGLAAGMAHEINNPLAGMMQTAEVMANRLRDNFHIPANQKAAKTAGTTMEAVEGFMKARGIPRMITTINESGRRLVSIVDNMLSFARKSDSLVSSRLLEDLLDKTLELAATDYDLKKHYDFKMIEIVKEYADNLPTVPCEAAKIQQVLLNILKNGAQAMQEGKVAHPRFNVRTWFEKERSMVCMEIEDNGPGMDEATCRRVFEPFFTTKPVGVGTGLGLSVSYFIITENHNGEMAVESRPGAGAKFIIRLPVGKGIN